MDNILYKEESYKIIGACFEVYNELGCGYLEAVYQEALERKFQLQNIHTLCERNYIRNILNTNDADETDTRG